MANEYLSNFGGLPARLYEFMMGTQVWRYTSADEDWLFNGQVYTSPRGGITDGGMRQTEQADQDSFEITCSDAVAIGPMFRGTPPSNTIFVTVREGQFGTDDAPVIWVGDVSEVGQTQVNQYKITCFTLSASFKRNGLRLSWERNCHHYLYDHLCKVNKNNFAVTATIQALGGTSITAAAFAGKETGWFAGGFVEWEIYPGTFERRGIDQHSGSTITLMALTDGLQVGQTIRAYAGCNRTANVCSSKFNNHLNYGGDPNLMGKSPFDGDPVF